MDNFSGTTESPVDLLKKVVLLRKLQDSELETLSKLLQLKNYSGTKEKPAPIINQGDEGDGFFIIQKGTCIVSTKKDLDDTKPGKEIGRLKGGDFFGETALLNACKRGATVSAVDETTVWFLSSEKFKETFATNKLNVTFVKRKAVSAEKSGGGHVPSYSCVVPVDAVKEKSPETRQTILNAVKFNVLFMNLSKEQQEKIINEMYRKEFKKDECAIVQDEVGDNLYVVEEGVFKVYVSGEQVAVRGGGTCFGELALMYNSPRAATVKASEDCVVWVVDRFTFRKVVSNVSEAALSMYTGFLKNVSLLSSLSVYEREKIAEALEEVKMPEGAVVMKEGDEGDAMYIVHKGSVVVTKKIDGEETEVNSHKSGDFFGERALLKQEPRAATVMTKEGCTLLKLDANAFLLLLGPLEDIMKKKVQSYDAPAKQENNAGPEATNGEKIKFDDLEVLGTLGKGSFGHVQLVKDKTTAKTYALKAVSKMQIVQTGQQGHIMSEKRAMSALNHTFLIRLYQTYKDADRLYFLLEPSLGGELFSVLREKTLFDEDTSRFYGAHVVLAFEYMHTQNFVYRDLKPENLLLDNDGYIKITDFGFAKDISGGRTWTLCGTPDYLAPEIVAGKGHGKGVDWWTLGIFIYEMLASYPPFYDEDPMRTYAKIMHGSITFPSHFSKEATSIVKKLLYHKSTKRLGVVKGGAKLIKKSPWFKEFDFDKLLKKEYEAPFVPNVKSTEDISNFDNYDDEEEEEQAHYTDDGSGWCDDF